MRPHHYTKELLYHFNCSNCKKWWSYAAPDKYDPGRDNSDIGPVPSSRMMFCPHCGHQSLCRKKERK